MYQLSHHSGIVIVCINSVITSHYSGVVILMTCNTSCRQQTSLTSTQCWIFCAKAWPTWSKVLIIVICYAIRCFWNPMNWLWVLSTGVDIVIAIQCNRFIPSMWQARRPRRYGAHSTLRMTSRQTRRSRCAKRTSGASQPRSAWLPILLLIRPIPCHVSLF